MKRKFTKAVAMMLSLIFMCSTFMTIPFTAKAASEHIEITLIDYPRGGGTTTWGHSALTLMNGWSMNNTSHFSAKAAENKGMQVAYCVQPSAALQSGDQNPEILPENFLGTYDNGALRADQIQYLLGRIFQYGYTGAVTISLSNDEITNMIASQVLVWEVIVGERNPDFSHNTPPAGIDAVLDCIKSEHPLRSLILSHYNRIVMSVINHSKIPSFLTRGLGIANTHELAWDGAEYSVTLSDSNGVLSNFDFSSATSGVKFTKNGNQLKISTTNPPSGTIEISASRTGQTRSAVTFWASGKIENKNQVQGLILSGQEISDPISGYVKIKVSAGTLEIFKSTTNNDGKVSGFDFRITKDGTVIGTYTSGNDGRITIPNLLAGWYKVEEINLSDDFVKPAPNPVDVEIKGGATATVNFSNIKKMGIIGVEKTNQNQLMGDYSLANAEFTVKDANGNVVDKIVTDASGKGQSKPLPLSAYTIFESKAPYGFVRDKNIYTRTLTGSLGTAAIVYCPKVTIPEMPQVGQIKITKLDAETAERPQGDATLNGAVFDILDSKGNLVERLYCGNNASITSKLLPLSTYTVREYISPKGYTLSQKEHPVTIEYAGDLVEVNLKSVNVENTVIKGRAQLIKHSDDPDPQIDPENNQVQQPLENIKFRIYLKSAGSYDKALPAERDEILTDSHGMALSKWLPYGIYVCEEMEGAAEHKKCDPFDIFVEENMRTYYFNIENPIYTGRVKIIKTDAETGKIIPQPNIEFRVKNTDTGKWVEQEIFYPSYVKLTSYLTAADGTLIMPELLHFGNFELWEVKSAYGYLLSEKPIPFTITSENPQELLEVKMPNMPVKGKVTIQKSGEMLAGANRIVGKDNILYVPKYEIRRLSGSVFDIIARSDVVTPDGTIRAKAGEVIDTVTTGPNGTATSKELYLSKDYYAVERVAAYGTVLNTTEYNFSLTYKDQYTAIVTAEISVYNERQKVQLNLSKICEMPKGAAKDYNPYAGIIFGLYAKEDVKTQDGETAIPAGSLMELIYFDKDGKAEIKTDLPFGEFFCKEYRSESGYKLNNTKYNIRFDYTDSSKKVVQIDVNGGNPVENKLERGSLKVIKTFENKDYPISDVPFTIIGHTTVGTDVTIEAKTDKNGEILLEGLLTGNYRIIELDCELTAGYVLSPEQAAVIAPDQLTEMTIHNKLQRGSLKIIKTFEGKTQPVAGVKFTVTGTSITGIPFSGEFETDSMGCILIEDLPVGKYKILELASELTTGYVLSEEQTAIIAPDKITEMKIHNIKIKGQLRIFKYTDNDTPIEGAVFGIYNEKGELVEKLTSGKNGYCTSSVLESGKYTVNELSAPEGFILNQTPFEMEITENGRIYDLKFKNERIPEKPGNPKTGDNSNLLLWLGLAVASICTMALCLTVKKRKNPRTH